MTTNSTGSHRIDMPPQAGGSSSGEAGAAASAGRRLTALSDGPFLKAASAGRLNLCFWLLLWPQYAIALHFQGPGLVNGSLASLAGSLAGCLILSPKKLKALGEMDWFINAWLVAVLTASSFSPIPVDCFIRGLICGLVTARKESLRCLMLPGLVPLIALAASFLLSRLKWLSIALAGWPIGFDWAVVGWPELAALVCAVLLLKAPAGFGRKIFKTWLTAGLALAAYYFFETFTPLDLSSKASLTISTRAAAFILPMLLVAPRAAAGRGELWLYRMIFALMLIFIPLPREARFFWGVDTAVFWAGAVLGISLALSRFSRPAKPAGSETEGRGLAATQSGNESPQHVNASAGNGPGRPFTAQLKCDHWGEAALIAKWRGLESCRLAGEQGGGFLLCPYGCLGLGDCRRVCPAQAVSLVNHFPVVDPHKCLGCGRCREVCPKKLFTLEDGGSRVFIPCASKSGLKSNADYCPRSCLGCGRCRKACPADAIDRTGPQGAMTVDQELCRAYGDECGQACVEACPRNIIKTL